jgi:hypothetical protein
MSSSSNTSIARKARTKAEADFATWLMMAKLGGFDDLPPNAQSFLTSYRTRLETMSETECQSAFKFDPVSASNFDPFERRVLTVALASSELAGVAETRRARVV